MKTIHLDEIKVGERQRKTFRNQAINQLKISIHTKGLLHAIVLRKEGSEYFLVAGERRIRAVRRLGDEEMFYSHDGHLILPYEIPYILVTDLSEVQIHDAELQENIIREELTWQERAAAIDALNELRRAKNPKQTFIDTAVELQGGEEQSVKTLTDEVSRAVIIAEHLDDPNVQRAESERKAFVIVQRKIEAEFVAELQKKQPEQQTHTLIEGDMTVELKKFHAEFNVLIVDPPYGVDAGKFGGIAAYKHQYEDTPGVAINIAEAIFVSGLDACVADAHLFMFCDFNLFAELRRLGEGMAWKVRRVPLIWSKGTSGHATDGGTFRHSYECILYATTGDAKLKYVAGDVIPAAGVRNKLHAAQKPIALYEYLLRACTQPGDKVLDPCCGSGTIFPVANRLSLIATGIEIDSATAVSARSRFSETAERREESSEPSKTGANTDALFADL